jgi:hypothetical protein|tara:strand:- start:1266 stop:1433 length:168 start_codon:yes stop_codon:yes gene_type:complete
MGNSCCAGGETSKTAELAYNSRTTNQVNDKNPNNHVDEKLLLAYSSNDKKQIVKI